MTLTSKGAKAANSAQEAGKVEAFEAAFQQYWGKVCVVLYRLLGDWAEAEDLALETFVQLYRRPPAEDSSLGGWLYRVATRLGLNALRSQRRRQKYEEEACYEIQADGMAWDPAAVFEKAQERARVRRALAQIKPRSAQLLVLRHSGLSYAEIAAALEISPGSVGTLLARAEKEFEQQYRNVD